MEGGREESGGREGGEWREVGEGRMEIGRRGERQEETVIEPARD